MQRPADARRRPERGSPGFSLLELVTVMVLIGILTAMVLPFSSRLDNDARRRNTDAAFERIRQAVLGPRGQTDASGQPLIGGYAGDTGELPRLIASRWSKAAGGWVYPDDDHDDALDLAEPYDPGSVTLEWFARHGHAQPLGLWANSTRTEDGKWLAAAPAGWRGPYLGTPRDPYPDDNGLEYSGDGGAEDRMFLLLECEGRLNDGWGRAFLALTEEEPASSGAPQSLVLVSAGPDGAYDPLTLLDENPSGTNADNLVYRITRHEYDNTSVKLLRTRAGLEALRSALVPPRRTAQDAQALPSGYAADLGGLDTLFGSLVYDSGDDRVYACRVSHSGRTSPPRSDSNYWTEAAPDRTLFPAIPRWRSGDEHHKPKPYLLFANADFAEADGVVYRCAAAECPDEPPSPDWVEAPDVGFPDLELEDAQGTVHAVAASSAWRALDAYNGTGVLPAWAVHGAPGQPRLPLGWRGGYARPAPGGPALWQDAWGRPLTVRLDAGRNIHLVSQGPDSGNAADDLTLTLYRHEYETAVEARVRTADRIRPETADAGDNPSMADLWAPLNGRMHVWRAWAWTGEEGPDGLSFRFGNDAAAAVLNPKAADPNFKTVLSDNATLVYAANATDEPQNPAARYVPVGQAYLEYRQWNCTSDASQTGYGSPHPKLTWQRTTQESFGNSTSCQNTALLFPGESRVGAAAVRLCE